MWPLWAYLLCGVLCTFLGVGVLVFLMFLKEEYEGAFMLTVVGGFVVLAGLGLGWLKYQDDLRQLQKMKHQDELKRELERPRPPAEAPCQ